jgi:hypothetical protein
VLNAVDVLGRPKIVGFAEDSQVRCAVLAPASDRHFVVELEKCPSAAPPPVIRDVRAPPSVARHDFTASRAVHVPGGGRSRFFSGSSGSALLSLLELCEEKVDCTLEDDLERAGWIRVPHRVASQV